MQKPFEVKKLFICLISRSLGSKAKEKKIFINNEQHVTTFVRQHAFSLIHTKLVVKDCLMLFHLLSYTYEMHQYLPTYCKELLRTQVLLYRELCKPLSQLSRFRSTQRRSEESCSLFDNAVSIPIFLRALSWNSYTGFLQFMKFIGDNWHIGLI